MRTLRMSGWAGFGGMVLVSALVMGLNWADAAEMQGASKEMQNGPVNHIGNFVAASHDMDTVVVDVPLEEGVLRVGAAVTEETKLLEDGKRIALEKFDRGDHVRLQFERVPDGNVAILLERLTPEKR